MCVILQIAFCHLPDMSIQEGFLEEWLGHSWLLYAPVVHWKLVSLICLKTRGSYWDRSERISNFRFQHCPQASLLSWSLKALKPGLDLASWLARYLSVICFQNMEDICSAKKYSSIINISKISKNCYISTRRLTIYLSHHLINNNS